MSVPRLVLCGLEPGPAIALAAGALLGCIGEQRSVRPLTLGLDLPLWRLLFECGARAPRVLDPALYDEAVAGELYDLWAEGSDMVMLVGVEPALDAWQSVAGSRPVDLAERLDAPLVLVVDARERGATAGAAVLGVQALAGRVELAGAIIVGADERAGGGELTRVVREAAGLLILGSFPPQLSEQFVRQYAAAGGSGRRQIGPRPVKGSQARLCSEAAGYLRRESIEEAATRRGFLPARQRRLLAPAPVAAGLTLAVAWGPPLEPLALENVDLLQAMGLDLAPFDLSRDRELPPGCSGLLLAGQLDEQQLPALAGSRELLGALADAIADGLPTLALGGGALLLLRRLSDSRGHSHELAGVLPAEAELLEWYERPRYVRANATRGNPFDEGETTLNELFDLEYLLLEQESFAYDVAAEGGGAQAEGFALPRCLATTLYPSLPACPGMAVRFVEAMRAADPRP